MSALCRKAVHESVSRQLFARRFHRGGKGHDARRLRTRRRNHFEIQSAGADVRTDLSRPFLHESVHPARVRQRAPGARFHAKTVGGAGPAGLAAAAVLARKGYSVTVFESSDSVGGAAKLIPEARLPRAVIEKDWAFVKTLGDITLKPNRRVANPVDLLKDGYDGVIVAVGEPHSATMGIPGEDLAVSFMDYLKDPEKYKTEGNVAVLGGGAVATDCAVTAKDSGAQNVEMFVRRRVCDMRLTDGERAWLLEKTIDITSMTRVEKIEKTGDTYTLYTCKTRFNGTKLEDIPDTTIKRPDFARVVMAVGSKADPKKEAERVVYAGDCNHGGSTIVEAVASGKNAANELHAAITGEVDETACPVSRLVTYKAKSCAVVEGVDRQDNESD